MGVGKAANKEKQPRPGFGNATTFRQRLGCLKLPSPAAPSSQGICPGSEAHTGRRRGLCRADRGTQRLVFILSERVLRGWDHNLLNHSAHYQPFCKQGIVPDSQLLLSPQGRGIFMTDATGGT